MTDEQRADAILIRMGFPPSETGRYVTALRASVRRQVTEHGLVNRSGGSWSDDVSPYDYEGRAKALLAADWELEQKHCFEVKAIDGVDGVADLMPWLGDRLREAKMKWRKWRNRGLVNPYREAA